MLPRLWRPRRPPPCASTLSLGSRDALRSYTSVARYSPYPAPPPLVESLLHPALRSCTIQLPFRPRAGSRFYTKVAGNSPAPVPPPVKPPAVEAPLQLRDYQEECIEAVLSHVKQGHHRLGVSLATGSGKTVIFTQLISRLAHPTDPERATQTLILAHRTELVAQAYRHCRRQYPDLKVEIEQAAQHASGIADITIASIRSIISGDRIEKFDPSRFKLVLIDEVHHAVATSYLKVLEHFGLTENPDPTFEALPGMATKPVLVGVSATMSRHDGMALGKVLDYIVYHRDYVDMISAEWLCPVSFTTVKSEVDLSRVCSSPGGDFQLGDLGDAVNTDLSNEIIVRTWLEKAGNRKSTLVFCVDIAHVDQVTDKFRSEGIDAYPITSNTPTEQRRRLLQEFKDGEFKVLVNCGIFTEGTDIPNIDCVLLARPTRSRNLLVQMIGRGMRLHDSKTDVHIIDMVGSIVHGIITVPTLMGLDPDEVLDKATIEDLKKKKEEKEEIESMEDTPSIREMTERLENHGNAKLTYVDYDTVFDLINDTTREGHIRHLSSLAWVNVGPGKYILGCSNNGHIRIVRDPSEGTFSAIETRRVPREVSDNPHLHMKPKVLLSGAQTLDDAVHGADTYVLSKYPWILLAAHSPWRQQPASPSQLAFLAKIRDCKPEMLQNLSKGQAADMLTKFKHGSVGHFAEIKKERRQIETVREREAKRLARETVGVGPLA